MVRASLFAAAVMLASVGHASAGPITFSLEDYPALQNGWTVSGSITLDMTGTSLGSGDITSWSYTLTNGGQTISGSSADSGSDTVTGTFSATSSELRVPSGSLILLMDGNQQLKYNNGGSGGFVDYSAFTDAFPAGTTEWETFNPDLDGNADGWLVGTVSASTVTPEPASLTLLGLGVAALAGYGWRRRQ